MRVLNKVILKMSKGLNILFDEGIGVFFIDLKIFAYTLYYAKMNMIDGYGKMKEKTIFRIHLIIIH